MVKVYALKENVKNNPQPAGHPKFNEDGEADWPMDGFTARRIKDGDISLDPPTKKLAHSATPKESPKT